MRFRGGGELEIGIDGPEDAVLRLAGQRGDPLELHACVRDELPPYAHVLLDVIASTSDLAVSGAVAGQA